MPLRPLLLDLRELPLGNRPVSARSFLEKMTPGEALLIVNDRDPEPLLQAIKPTLDKGYTYWIPEEGPEIWRILISREDLP